MRAFGIDTYKRYQQYYEPQPHHDFVFTKISEGGSIREGAEDMLKGDAVFGGYHYYRTSTPRRYQQKVFLRGCEGLGLDIIIVDAEYYSNLWTISAARDLVKILRELLETEYKVLLYTNPRFLLEVFLRYPDELSDEIAWLRNFDGLWIAQYNSMEWTAWEESVPYDWNKNPWLPPGFETWLFWQFSSSAPGEEHGVGSSRVDVNVFNGTPTQMHKWLNKTPEPTPDADEYFVWRTPVRIRTEPSFGNTWRGLNVTVGKKYPVLEKRTTNGYLWIRHHRGWSATYADLGWGEFVEE